MAGQLGGCAPFPVFAGIEKGDTQLSEILSFRIHSFLACYHLCTFLLLGTLKKNVPV